LALLSFRDPNLASTLETYNGAPYFLKTLTADRMTDEELVKGIIGAIGLLDAYQLPDARGFSSMLRYLSGETDEMRQVFRDQLLTTTRADFNAFGNTLEEAMKSGVVAVVGAKEALEKSGAGLDIITVL
jgi:Zn-dependent M16 (insulinase) family peptidase